MRAVTLALLLGLVVGCSDEESQVRLIFPDPETRSSISSIRWRAFAPLEEDGQFVRCEDIGRFGNPEGIDVEELEDRVSVLAAANGLSPTQGFSYGIDLPNPDTSRDNPWGALTLVIEAMANLESEDSTVLRPVARSCTCLRTDEEGKHPDPGLDAEIKQQCISVDELAELRMQPLVSRAFTLRRCGLENLSAPKGGAIDPSVRVCVTPVSCDDDPANCRDCGGPCLNSLQFAPIRVRVTGSGFDAQVVLTETDEEGALSWSTSLEGCSDSFQVEAELLARPDSLQILEGRCFDEPNFPACSESTEVAGSRSVLQAVSVPGEPYDFVGLLRADNAATVVELVDPRTGERLFRWTLAGETPAALHAFDGSSPQEPLRPILAVATVAANLRVPIRVMEFDRQGVLTETATLTAPCGRWSCGALSSCQGGCDLGLVCDAEVDWCVSPGPTSNSGSCSTGPAQCGCELIAGNPDDVTLKSALVDRDERPDLLAAAAGSRAVTTWFSRPDSFFSEEACRCGQYTQLPEAIAVAPLSGDDEEDPFVPDLLLSATNALYLQAGETLASGEQVLPCGRPDRLSGTFAQRLDLMRILCTPGLDASCGPEPDLVMLDFNRADTTGIPSYRVALILGTDAFDSVFGPERIDVGVGQSFEVADIDADGREDLLILSDTEAKIFFGQTGPALGASSNRLDFGSCSLPCADLGDGRFLVGNFEGDSRKEVMALCQGRLQWFRW